MSDGHVRITVIIETLADCVKKRHAVVTAELQELDIERRDSADVLYRHVWPIALRALTKFKSE